MKNTKKLLSVLIAQTLLASTATHALDIEDFEIEDSSFEGGFNFGGHIGSSLEYEDKKTDGFNGKTKNEKIKTNEVFNVFLRNSAWNASMLYALKQQTIEMDEGNYYENEDGLKHLLSLNKGFNLGDGWATGLIYDVEHTESKLHSASVNGLRKTLTEHSVRPYLTYWNNANSWGFYSNLEYLYSDDDQSQWGSREEEGYSILFKPYKRVGQWELGVEFFYQVKDNDGVGGGGGVSENSEFTEKYIEPIIQYSFEDAGTMYVRARFGENDTSNSGGNADIDYYKDIRKVTVGYEQTVADNWLLKAEYEYANEEEEKSKMMSWDAQDTSDMTQHKVYIHALYRF